jgi:hypothetical protein
VRWISTRRPTGSALSPARSTFPSAASRSSPDHGHQTGLTPSQARAPGLLRSSGSSSRPESMAQWILQPAQDQRRSASAAQRRCPNIQLRIGSCCCHHTAARVHIRRISREGSSQRWSRRATDIPGRERPAESVLPKLTRHAWTAICRSVRYGWLVGWSDGELPAAAGGSRRGGYPGRAARAHPAAGVAGWS